MRHYNTDYYPRDPFEKMKYELQMERESFDAIYNREKKSIVRAPYGYHAARLDAALERIGKEFNKKRK